MKNAQNSISRALQRGDKVVYIFLLRLPQEKYKLFITTIKDNKKKMLKSGRGRSG